MVSGFDTTATSLKSARILDRHSILDIAWCGLLMGGLSMASYLLYYARHGVDPLTDTVPAAVLASAMSITYVTIMVCQLVRIVQRRSVHGFFSRYQLHNRSFWWAVIVADVIMVAVGSVPFVARFFGTAPLSLLDWGYVGLAAAVFLGLREGARLIQMRTQPA